MHCRPTCTPLGVSHMPGTRPAGVQFSTLSLSSEEQNQGQSERSCYARRAIGPHQHIYKVSGLPTVEHKLHHLSTAAHARVQSTGYIRLLRSGHAGYFVDVL